MDCYCFGVVIIVLEFYLFLVFGDDFLSVFGADAVFVDEGLIDFDDGVFVL